jgi:hypothetical protein
VVQVQEAQQQRLAWWLYWASQLSSALLLDQRALEVRRIALVKELAASEQLWSSSLLDLFEFFLVVFASRELDGSYAL